MAALVSAKDVETVVREVLVRDGYEVSTSAVTARQGRTSSAPREGERSY